MQKLNYKIILISFIAIILIFVFCKEFLAFYSIKNGNNAFETGNYDLAEKYYKKALKYKNSDILNYNLAGNYFENGDFTGALEYYSKTNFATGSQNYYDTNFNLGNTYYYLGEINPDNNAKIQNFTLALQSYENVLNLKEIGYVRENYEIVKKKLENLQENSENQDNSQENQNSEQNNGENSESGDNSSGNKNSESKENSTSEENGNEEKNNSNEENSGNSQNGENSSENGNKGQNSEQMSEEELKMYENYIKDLQNDQEKYSQYFGKQNFQSDFDIFDVFMQDFDYYDNSILDQRGIDR